MADAILALNAGSSSIKFGLYEIVGQARLTLVSRGALETRGSSRLVAKDAGGAVLCDRSLHTKDTDLDAGFAEMLDWIEAHLGGERLVAAGHRIVHGGRDFGPPVFLTADVLAALDKLTPLAPLHQPRSLAPIHALTRLRADLPQIGCFDTAFHATMDATVRRFALPREYEDAGIRRYGFHGLSYEFIAARLREISPDIAAGRTVVAHLGNGASLCALRDGQSVDTTMGFSALDGLVMGTRCGAIDPGVLLYLQSDRAMGAAEMQQLLYEESGLLGVSGISSDMRNLLASREARAREAVDLFVFRASREVAAMANTLQGLDCLVFTAGIGERAPDIRAAICERLGWLGVKIDADANATNAALISSPDSRVEVRVMPTDEELVIARHTADLLSRHSCYAPHSSAHGPRRSPGR